MHAVQGMYLRLEQVMAECFQCWCDDVYVCVLATRNNLKFSWRKWKFGWKLQIDRDFESTCLLSEWLLIKSNLELVCMNKQTTDILLMVYSF